MTEQRFWPCGHIFNKDGYWFFKDRHNHECNHWLICPLCEAKRPEPKQTTVEQLVELFENTEVSIHPALRDERKAKAAIEFFKELIEEVHTKLPLNRSYDDTYFENLKERLRS